MIRPLRIIVGFIAMAACISLGSVAYGSTSLSVGGSADAECAPPQITIDGTDLLFTMLALHDHPDLTGWQRGHWLYVWVEQADGDFGRMRNIISADTPNIIRLRLDDGDADRLVRYETGSYAKRGLIDWTSPVTGKWYYEPEFAHRCRSEGMVRAPLQ